jgi:hypothetical protein
MAHELLKTFSDIVVSGKQLIEAAERLDALIHQPATDEQFEDLLTVYRAHGAINGDTAEGALRWWKDVAGVVHALKLAAELARDTLETQPLGEEMLPPASDAAATPPDE